MSIVLVGSGVEEQLGQLPEVEPTHPQMLLD
jgi:hypothetical protein